MRLWHKKLIPVLPRQQLVGQWRECCLIAKNIFENGNPNHILVNRIMDYSIEHFFRYACDISGEMKKRGYKCDFSKFIKYIKDAQYVVEEDELFYSWHDERYLRQCLYNLQEKFDCGGISLEEWKVIVDKFGEKLLW